MKVYRFDVGGELYLVGHCLWLPYAETFHVAVIGGKVPGDPFVRHRYRLRQIPDAELDRPMLAVRLSLGQTGDLLPGWRPLPTA